MKELFFTTKTQRAEKDSLCLCGKKELNNRIDAHGCVALAMTLLAFILFAALELEDDDLVGAPVSEHCRFDFLLQERRAYMHVRAVGDRERIQLNACADILTQARHAHDLPLGDTILFSTRSNYCVSHGV